MSNRTSEKKTPLFGNDYVQHYDSDGMKSGRSEQEGDHVQHYDRYGNKTGTSKVNVLGETEHFDQYGQKIGYSKEDVLGNVEHYDNRGRHTGTTSKKSSWSNEYTHQPVESDPRVEHLGGTLNPIYMKGGPDPRDYNTDPAYSKFGDRINAGISYVQGITCMLALLMVLIPGHYLFTAAYTAAEQPLLTFAFLGALLCLWPLLHRTKLAKKKADPALRKSGSGMLVIHLLFTMSTAVAVMPGLYEYLMASFSAYSPISHIFRALPVWAALVVYGLFLGIATNVAMKQHREHRATIVDLSKICNGCYSILLSLPFSFMLFLQDAYGGIGSRIFTTVVGIVILLLLYKVITVAGNFIYALTIRFRR